jgi:hypothetical protein
MIKKILSLINPILPLELAMKALNKADPRVRKFLTTSAKAGIGANAALDFLRNNFKDTSQEAENKRLVEGQVHGTLRPDEGASLSERRDRANKNKNLGTLVKSATSLAGGSGLLGRLGGLLDEEEPLSLTEIRERENIVRQQETPQQQAYRQYYNAKGQKISNPENAQNATKSQLLESVRALTNMLRNLQG